MARQGDVTLVVAGLVPLSSVDYPAALSAVVFCRGCPWRCRYCQNAALRDPAVQGGEDFATFLGWLEGRRGLLDAVVFSGGEPTGRPGLGLAMDAVRAMGFRIGLHTAGIFPETLAAVLPLCDWVGLDIKAPRSAYDRITGAFGSAGPAFDSLALVREAGVSFEIRTTWHPALLQEEELMALAGELVQEKVGAWVVQPFRPTGCIDMDLAASGPAVVPPGLVEELSRVAGTLAITVRN